MIFLSHYTWAENNGLSYITLIKCDFLAVISAVGRGSACLKTVPGGHDLDLTPTPFRFPISLTWDTRGGCSRMVFDYNQTHKASFSRLHYQSGCCYGALATQYTHPRVTVQNIVFTRGWITLQVDD